MTFLSILQISEQQHGKAYELGYFIGSNIFYILPVILLVIVAFIFGIKALRKTK
ncbi:hypothetical protein [Leeuwenhoekiella parthenopeia]|uniref:Uncharacterized protein n=1 Tax=Leeuwenhoekiella parthenopeia TaxID=2890320 RepID=A0ABS8GQI7_9FLAO|nr:hypothetical protein [Leeuwenhoekiella parthenopeia]MCC4212249.1 hypothetical protein [Leeuwenhoekiella parthenopeia]